MQNLNSIIIKKIQVIIKFSGLYTNLLKFLAFSMYLVTFLNLSFAKFFYIF